jgi:hypothetical protein
MSTIRLLTWRELKDKGIVMEINRRLLHPRGMALRYNVAKPDDPEAMVSAVWFYQTDVERLREVFAHCESIMREREDWDERWATYFAGLMERVQETLETPEVANLQIMETDDPEGFVFGDLDEGDRERAARFIKLVNLNQRVKACGFIVEPHVGKKWQETEP